MKAHRNEEKLELAASLPLRKEMPDTCLWSWAKREGDTGLNICVFQEYEAMACQQLRQMFGN